MMFVNSILNTLHICTCIITDTCKIYGNKTYTVYIKEDLTRVQDLAMKYRYLNVFFLYY